MTIRQVKDYRYDTDTLDQSGFRQEILRSNRVKVSSTQQWVSNRGPRSSTCCPWRKLTYRAIVANLRQFRAYLNGKNTGNMIPMIKEPRSYQQDSRRYPIVRCNKMNHCQVLLVNTHELLPLIVTAGQQRRVGSSPLG